MGILTVQLVLLALLVLATYFFAKYGKVLRQESQELYDCILELNLLKESLDTKLIQNRQLIRECQEKLDAAKRYMGVHDED